MICPQNFLTWLGLRCPLLILVSCCTSACSAWVVADGKVEYASRQVSGFSVIPPRGWYGSLYSRDERLQLTKDGPGLQYVVISRRDRPKSLRRFSRNDALDRDPMELADEMVLELRDREELANLELIDTRRASIAGQVAYRIDVSYTSKEKLEYRAIIYGLPAERGIYDFEFHAPSIHFFDRDAPDFEAIVQSFTEE